MKTIKLTFLTLLISMFISCEKNVEDKDFNKNRSSIDNVFEIKELQSIAAIINKLGKDNAEQALTLCNRLIETAVTKGQKAMGYYEKAYVYDQFLENYSDALSNYLYASTLYKELGVSIAVNECLLGMGGIYYKLHEFDKALSYYQQALTNTQQINNKEGHSKIYYAIANCHMALGKNLSLIVDNYTKALSILQELKDEVAIGNCYHLIGNAYYFINQDFPQAKKYYLQAAIIFQSENKMEELGNVYYNLGLLHNEMKEIEVARNYFKQSIELGKQYNYPDLVVSGEFQLGKMQANLRNYSQAINHGLAALSVIRHNQLIKAEIIYFLAQSYETIGNKDQALAYSNQTIQLNKKNEENKLTYLSKENEQRATVHDFEIKIDKNATNNLTSWMIGGIVFIFLLTYVLTRIYYRKQNIGLLQAIKVSQARNQEFKSTLADARKQLLYFSREIGDLKNRLGI